MPSLARQAQQSSHYWLEYEPGKFTLWLHQAVWSQMIPSLSTPDSRYRLLLGRDDESYLPTFVMPEVLGEGFWGFGSTWSSRAHSSAPLWRQHVLELKPDMLDLAAMATFSMMVHWLTLRLKEIPDTRLGSQLLTFDGLGVGPRPGGYAIEFSTVPDFYDRLQMKEFWSFEQISEVMQQENQRLAGYSNDHIRTWDRGDSTLIISPGGNAAGAYEERLSYGAKVVNYGSSNMDGPLHQIIVLVGLAQLWSIARAAAE